MPEAEITPTKNGPYMVTGDFVLQDRRGNKFDTDAEIYLCRCGASKDKPFCDGTHTEIGFESDVSAR